MLRLTRRVFDDLALWMVGFGMVTGLLFPPLVAWMGAPPEVVLTPQFLGLCLIAGAIVGVVNIALTRNVVRPRLGLMAEGMSKVANGLLDATFTGDWSNCDPEACRIEIASDDELGECADNFNALVGALHRSHGIEAAMGAFSTEMASQLKLAPLCNTAIQLFLSHTGVQGAAVLLDVGGELSVGAAHAIRDPDKLRESNHVRRAFETGRVESVDLPPEVRLEGVLSDFRPATVLILPVGHHGVGLGVVVLSSSSAMTREARALAEMFTRTFSVALNNALTHERLERVAALDPLTNAYNRRFGGNRLREEFTRSARSETPLAVLMFDIDHFKAVNDTYGHLTGDRVLAQVAAVARRQLREGDVLVRYGGEEFLVLLPGAVSANAGAVAERIREAVEGTSVLDGGKAVQVTISVGHSAWPELQSDDETALIRAADEALYRAKEGGRNRVVAA